MVLGYFCFLTVVISARSASAPFINPCVPNDNACLIASAQAAVPFVAPGIPELSVHSLDPMKLDYVKGDTAGLQLTLRDTLVDGMKNCKVEGITHDLSKNKQSLTIRCTVHLSGEYTLGGRIVILPVEGNGKYDIDIRDIVIKAATALEVVPGADGKEHWHIKSWKHSYLTKGNAHFDFQNLFNGNKILSTPVQNFLNTSWQEVMKEVAPPIVYAIVERVVQAVEALYAAVPADQLTL